MQFSAYMSQKVRHPWAFTGNIDYDCVHGKQLHTEYVQMLCRQVYTGNAKLLAHDQVVWCTKYTRTTI